MASARSLTRALRSVPTASTFKTATPRQVDIPCRNANHAFRRGYASQRHQSLNSKGAILSGVAAVAVLGTGYYVYGLKPMQLETPIPESFKAPSTSGQKNPTIFTPTTQDYQKVYDAIAKKLIDEDDYDDGSYGPVLVRLGWHSSGTYDKLTKTGGSNGATMRFAPEGDHGANAGLKAARDFLEPVKEQFPWITHSDLWTLGATCAIQEMGGPDIAWRPGRSDRDVAYCTPDGRLPDASKGSDHLRGIFYRMGFNDQEIVALSGAHALGRCHTDRSGFEGPWTFSPITMTNDYFKLLLDEEWDYRNWNGPRQFQDNKTKTLMMLPTDVVLIKDEGFRPHVDRYAKDQEEFFKEFSEVIMTLFELGVPFESGKEARNVFRRTE
ncbi:heme peroxidase [Elasticomyces elasticus]|nr:heme peroxidase [Elasticomyces elasticus]KAK3655627.1 heme peroxidase [Elasticomyces elasticus]KAK4910285.1 heme peroxidase [Elasticomyces elasticus]KAK5748523.1 heme peroxidase [Elasticomyces elasticus]